MFRFEHSSTPNGAASLGIGSFALAACGAGVTLRPDGSLYGASAIGGTVWSLPI